MNEKFILPLFLMLSSFLLYGSAFAESQKTTFPVNAATMKGQSGRASAFAKDMDVVVKSDGFDGSLYFYSDGKGNRCVTNSLDIFIAKSGSLRAAEPALSTDPAELPKGDQWALNESGGESDESAGYTDSDEYQEGIPDPLEKLNRAFFQFNDKLYFWFLKPLASGYGAVVPRDIRKGVKNLFHNLSFPIRFVNCLLQAKIENAGDELCRFVVNSTIGVAGLVDVANTEFHIKGHEEDLGQTLATYGVGPGFFINWPVLGPSSVRGTIGFTGDSFLDPLNYMIDETEYIVAVMFYETINNTSLVIGEYEDLKKASLDPYIAMRNAYFQYRLNKIKE